MGLSSLNATASSGKAVIGYKVVRYGRLRSFKITETGIYQSKAHMQYAYLLSFPKYNDLLIEHLRFSPYLTTAVSFEAIARRVLLLHGVQNLV